MNTTGIFTISKYSIPFSRYGQPIYLKPFGDVHRSSHLCHTEKWHEFLEESKQLMKKYQVYFIGVGDYDDLASTSEREILENKRLHESTKVDLDSVYRKHVLRFYNEIKFMKGRLIGCIEGNHYSNLCSGITTTQLLCDMMGCKYLGVSAFIELILRRDEHHAHRINIWGHHGRGAGRSLGGSINSVAQMVDAADADIYLMGHDHKKHAAMKSRLYLSDSHAGLNLENRKIILARTGGFLKGYENDKPSYIADGAFSPTDIGTVTITMTPKRKRQKDFHTKQNIEKRWVELEISL